MKIGIDGSGRIVVPKRMRERLGVVGPAKLELVEGDGQLVIRPLAGDVELLERDGVLVADRGEAVAPLDWGAVRDMVERQRR